MYLISLILCRVRNKVLQILTSNKLSTFDSVYYKTKLRWKIQKKYGIKM